MFKLNQKGVIQYVVLLILVGGVAAGVWLVTAGPLKLFPKAVSAPITSPTTVNLTPPPGSVTPNGLGSVIVEVISYDQVTKLVNLKLRGTLNSLGANRTYKVWVCLISGADCSTFATPKIVTNSSGAASFSDLNISIFDRSNLPISSIKVIEETAGAIPEDSCYVSTLPCLQGSYSLSPLPSLTPTPISVSAPVVIPTRNPTPSPTPSLRPSPTPAGLKPDLTIEKVEILGAPQAGSNADFNIVVKNIGQATASHENSILINVVIRKPNDVVLGSCIWAFNNLAAGATTQATRIKDCPKYNITGQHKIEVSVDPHTEGILGLDRIAESNEENNTKELLVNISTSVSGPIGGSSAPRVISQFRYAENPADLQKASWQTYNQRIVVSHIFSDSTPGLRFIFIQFRDDKDEIVKINGQEYISSSIELIAEATPTPPEPSPSPSSVPTPTTQPAAPGGGGGGGGSSGGGGGGGGGSQPATRIIGQYRVAENPADLQNALWQAYNQNIVVAYTFTDSSPGAKFIFVQFADANNQIIPINGQNYITSSPITLLEPTPTSTPAPAANIPNPLANDGPNCPISNPSNYDIGTLYTMCSVNQLARFDLKWLVDFPNEILIDIGRRKGDLGGFLANFSGERLIGVSPYEGSGFSTDILKQLPDWRKQQLPGYIQDQLK